MKSTVINNQQSNYTTQSKEALVNAVSAELNLTQPNSTFSM